jgi:hypothetical protein
MDLGELLPGAFLSLAAIQNAKLTSGGVGWGMANLKNYYICSPLKASGLFRVKRGFLNKNVAVIPPVACNSGMLPWLKI